MKWAKTTKRQQTRAMVAPPFHSNISTQQERRMPSLPATDQGYSLATQSVADIFACSMTRAQAIAHIPIIVRKIGNEQEVMDSPWYTAVRFARKRFHQDLLFRHEWALAIWGKNYELKLVQENGFTPGGLQWLNPQAITVQAPRGYIERYDYQGSSQSEKYKPKEIGHNYTPNSDSDIDGDSPIRTGLSAADNIRNAAAYVGGFFAHDASVGGIISGRSRSAAFGNSPIPMTDEDRETIMKMWNAQTQGARKSFKTILLPFEVEYSQFEGKPPTQQVDLIANYRRDIHMVMRVPMSLTYAEGTADPLSAGSTLTREQAIFWENFVIPEHKSILNYYNVDIMPWLAPGEELVGDYSKLLAAIGDTAERRTMLRADVTAGLMTYNKYQDEIGEKPVPGGDVLYIPGGAVVTALDDLSTPEPIIVEGEATPLLPAVAADTQSNADKQAENKIVLDQLAQGLIDLWTATTLLGQAPVEAQRGMFWVGNQLVPQNQLANIWKYGTLIAPSTTNADLIVQSEPETLPTDEPTTEEDIEQDELVTLDRAPIMTELKAWRKWLEKRIKSGQVIKRQYKCEHIPPPWVDEIKADLEKYAPDNDLSKIADVFWTAMETYKDLNARVQAFERKFATLLGTARGSDPLPKARYRTIVRSEIQRFGRLMFREGLIDGGVQDGVPDPEEAKLMNSLITAFTPFVRSFVNEVYGTGLTDVQAASKPQMWSNKLVKLYQEGLSSANGNQMQKFIGTDGRDSCQTCQALKGQVHRAKDWRRRELRPGIDGHNYECGAWQCDHDLDNVSSRAIGTFPSNAQIRAWAAKSDEYLAAHPHTHK